MIDKEAFEQWCASMGFLPTQARYETWQAAIAHERERCAKVCIWVVRDASMAGRCLDSEHDYVAAAHDCAEAIRRGEP